MDNLTLNPCSYIYFSPNKEKKKENSYTKRTVNAFLPYLNFYQPTAKLLTGGTGVIKSWFHMQEAIQSGQAKKWGAVSLEILQLVTTITTTVGLFFQYRAALALNSGYEMIQDGKIFCEQVRNKQGLSLIKTTLSLGRHVINLASVMAPSPQLIAICLGAQVVAQLYQTVKTARTKGLSIETLAQCGLTVIYSYQLTKQIQLVIQLSKINLLKPFFISIDQIKPGQLRYSSKNVEEKVNKILKDGQATFDHTSGKWSYKYDENQSVYSLDNAVPAVVGPDGFILLVDGHHDVLASLALQAKTMPVKVIQNWENMSIETFWARASESGYAYLYDLQGQKKLPPLSFTELSDDPNRYFAAISARKLLEGGTMDSSIGADYPLWIKIGKSIPFIEFKISDVMKKHGLIYDYEIANNPEAWAQFVEKARVALKESPIEGLKLVENRIYYKDIDLSPL